MDTLLQVSLTLLAAGLAAKFALHTYFKQREYELVMTRYLDNGVDHLATDLEAVAATFAHNWARCLDVLKNFRDLGEHFDSADLNRGFLEMRASHPQVAAHHCLHTLTGSSVFWQAHQKATGFYTSANAILTSEIPTSLRVCLTPGVVDATNQEIAERAFKIASDLNDDHIRYIRVIEELRNLSRLLEQEKFSFKGLEKFRDKTEVIEATTRVADLLRQADEDGA